MDDLKDRPLSAFYEPTPEECAILSKEKRFRKQGTAYKREKEFDKAVEMMRCARSYQYQTSLYYDIKTLLRIPKYLVLAKRYQEALDETNDILRGKWGIAGTTAGNGQHECRALVALLTHEVASEAARKMGNEVLAKSHEEEALRAEHSMPSMRIVDLKEEARKCDWTIWRIGGCGLPGLPCEKWHDRVITIGGVDNKYPSIDQVDIQAVFGNDNPHGVYAVYDFESV